MDPGGQAARVSASGPSSRAGPEDFQVPRPRLQSMRALRLPSDLNSIVYLAGSSGLSRVSSPPRNSTSRHTGPTRRTVSAPAGVAVVGVSAAFLSTGGVREHPAKARPRRMGHADSAHRSEVLMGVSVHLPSALGDPPQG